ncbi:hypothetical protein CSQ96_28935 [Janthinobacterium sp. BJB412]|nr:hypothetical protein CSQ96_28935 [Janthinobacterium sp. BJB412]
MSHAMSLPPAQSPNSVLAIIVASYLMVVVDISIVITGLPRIQASLGFSAAQLSWVSNAYTLTFGGLLLLGARAGDILGRRRMFIVGQADAGASYWTSVAPPMLLIGLGQGLLLGPLTAAGVAGVARDDAGAAAGLVNVAHQLGGALGLGLLVLVFASAAPAGAHDSQALALRISAVMDAAGLLLALALIVSWTLIVLPRRKVKPKHLEALS